MSRLLCHGDDSRTWCQVLFVFQLRRRKRRRRKSLRSPMTTWDSAFSIKLLELINKVFTKSLLCSFSLYFKTCVWGGCVIWPDRAYSLFGYVILFSLMEKKNWKGSGWWDWAQCSVDGAVEPLSAKADDTKSFIFGLLFSGLNYPRA